MCCSNIFNIYITTRLVENRANTYGATIAYLANKLWQRPRDIALTISFLLDDPFWGNLIDASRIGMMGFSAGGDLAAHVGDRLLGFGLQPGQQLLQRLGVALPVGERPRGIQAERQTGERGPELVVQVTAQPSPLLLPGGHPLRQGCLQRATERNGMRGRADLAGEIFQEPFVLGSQLLAGGPTPSQQVAKRELARRLRQALGELPTGQREVLLMRNFEGLSYQEVAYVLDIDAAAARKRYGRALLQLRQHLLAGGFRESEL